MHRTFAETKKQEDRKIARKQKRESIVEGELDPLITPVSVVYNSEDDTKDDEEDAKDDEDELENTKNNSEPDGDFVLKEAARIVADLVKLKHEKLVAKTHDKVENKL